MPLNDKTQKLMDQLASEKAQLKRSTEEMSAELMDSIGVMMVRRQAKDFSFRNYQGYNVITVEY